MTTVQALGFGSVSGCGSYSVVVLRTVLAYIICTKERRNPYLRRPYMTFVERYWRVRNMRKIKAKTSFQTYLFDVLRTLLAYM